MDEKNGFKEKDRFEKKDGFKEKNGLRKWMDWIRMKIKNIYMCV